MIQQIGGGRIECWADDVHPDALSVNDHWYHLTKIESLQVANGDTPVKHLDLIAATVVLVGIVVALANFEVATN